MCEMNTKTIITIGREFGSAGKEIGSVLAKRLQIKLYNEEMLERASQESGMCKNVFETHDEKPKGSFLYSLVMDTYSLSRSAGTYSDMPLNHKVFLAQFDAIQKIASEGSCILIGRCADYALTEYENVLNVFIYADLKARVKRIQRIYELDENKAKDLISKTDKKRRSYYNYFTNKNWSDVTSYDLCLNSATLGIDGVVSTIESAIKNRETNSI
jgi:Cytidylate kinase